MLRLLLLIIVSFLSSGVFAAETAVPSLFDIAEEDKSLAYLGAIFGNQLVPGGTDMHLLSHIFEVFNQVCLSVGLIIIIYTLIVGTLHTAGQGKPLGEKWNGLWIPVRMVVGMSLLVPKAGTGYCMAQYVTMWLILQGIGAADTVWNKALDYFIEGGAIYSNTLGKAQSYMNKGNLENTYLLEEYILISVACIEAHNETADAELFGKYDIYSTDDEKYVNFGNPKVWDGTVGGAGQECGGIIMPAIDEENQHYDLMLTTYNNAFYSMSMGLTDVGKFLASEAGSDDTQWPAYFSIIQSNAVTFIEYLKGASNILFPDQGSDLNDGRTNLEELKKYGWVLAGNYYMTLSSFSDKLEGITIIVPTRNIGDPTQDSQDKYADAIYNSKEFWGSVDTTPERYANTFAAWPDEYKYQTIPGYEDIYSQDALDNKNYGVNKKDLEDIQAHIKQLGNLGGAVSSTSSGHGPSETASMSPIYYMDQITGLEGENGGQDRDPILRAAKFGKTLTDVAVAMIFVYFGLIFIFLAGAWFFGWFQCTSANAIIIPFVLMIYTTPLVFAIASFLYVQGVMLGVILPLIPFIIFLVGVLGWYLSVIESIVAAPLVAIGLIFPETQQEVWGRAEPAYMMILNLFLRPSLMVIGLLAGMILSWIAIELLNAAYYLFIVDGAHIENVLFGYIILTMVYVTLVLAVVTKAFGLINDLPNKVLMWIGDKSQQQEGAGEMIGAAKGGAEKGAQAAAGGIGTAGKLTGKAQGEGRGAGLTYGGGKGGGVSSG